MRHVIIGSEQGRGGDLVSERAKGISEGVKGAEMRRGGIIYNKKNLSNC